MKGRLIALSFACAALVGACGSGSHPKGAHRSSSLSAQTVASAPPPKPSPPKRTSCRSVVYIGDSTSDGEASAEFVPQASLRAPAQLAKVGVKTTHMRVSGARSIHEIYKGIPNGAMVARQEVSSGYHGCWILALGTNDAADVAAGSTFGLKTRINQMMSIIGRQPVMWVNVITLPNAATYYSESGMRRWNADLLAACSRYPMMRVFDWAAVAKPQWFIPDGIHYTPVGYIARTKAIARALVKAFPQGQAPGSLSLAQLFAQVFPRTQLSHSCLVR
jgi:lysophospholipase L1-like esterase